MSPKFQRRTYGIRPWQTRKKSLEVYLGDSNNDRQSEMAAKTGNAYISETVKGTVKIPTSNLGYTVFQRHIWDFR